MKMSSYLVLMAAAVCAVLLRSSLADGGCTSYITSHNNKKCVFTTFNCTDFGCSEPGQPCSPCTENLLQAFCISQQASRCLELHDCDGCGVIVEGECEYQNDELVCRPITVTEYACLRAWCSVLPSGEGP